MSVLPTAMFGWDGDCWRRRPLGSPCRPVRTAQSSTSNVGPMVVLSPQSCEGLADRLRRIAPRSRRGSTVPGRHIARRRAHSDRPRIGRMLGRTITRRLAMAAMCSEASDAAAGGAGVMTGGHDAPMAAMTH